MLIMAKEVKVLPVPGGPFIIVTNFVKSTAS